jgi:hypothetical protein
MAVPDVRIEPSGGISPLIDGEVTSYFEWMGAGVYRVDERSGSMHGKKVVVQEVQFGSDGVNFYLRVDFRAGYLPELSGMEARLKAQSLDGEFDSYIAIAFSAGGARPTEMRLAALPEAESADAVECALGRVLEVQLSLKAMGIAAGNGLRFQFSLWHSALPIDAVPNQGWLEMRTTNPVEMGG